MQKWYFFFKTKILQKLYKFSDSGICETFVCHIDDVKSLCISISMNELLELNINKFGEKIITYTNQIYSLISKLRRVCIIASEDYPYINMHISLAYPLSSWFHKWTVFSFISASRSLTVSTKSNSSCQGDSSTRGQRKIRAFTLSSLTNRINLEKLSSGLSVYHCLQIESHCKNHTTKLFFTEYHMLLKYIKVNGLLLFKSRWSLYVSIAY
jgi:hypothetical protein